MIGAGLQSVGVSQAGHGDWEPTPDAPTAGTGARYLNSAGDYTLDPSTGSHAKISANAQRVLLAITTELNSSALDNFGILDPRKISASFEGAAKNSVRAALRFMTDAGDIRIDDIIIAQVTPTRIRRTVVFTDLKTGLSESVSTR